MASMFLLVGIFGCNKPAEADEEKSVDSIAKTVAADAAQHTAQIDKVIVYYFHNTRRCATCLGIQRVIEETIDTGFTKDIEAGMLEFRELNMEEEPNKKYVQQFQLSFGTMVVAAEANGETRKWENAGKVWELAQSPDELKAYVEKNIRQQLDLIGRRI